MFFQTHSSVSGAVYCPGSSYNNWIYKREKHPEHLVTTAASEVQTRQPRKKGEKIPDLLREKKLTGDPQARSSVYVTLRLFTALVRERK